MSCREGGGYIVDEKEVELSWMIRRMSVVEEELSSLIFLLCYPIYFS